MQAVGLQDLQALAGVVDLPAHKYEGPTQRPGHGVLAGRGQLLPQQPGGELSQDVSCKGSAQEKGGSQ